MNTICFRSISRILGRTYKPNVSHNYTTTWFNRNIPCLNFCTHLQNKSYSTLIESSSNSKEWNRVVWDAEKLVGYPTSYLSLKFLLSDEFSNTALHFRKLIGTNHPFMTTLKRLIYNGRTNLQTRGLIILLLSKAMGHTKNSKIEESLMPEQRSLAEITELVHTAQLIHETIVNLPDADSIDSQDIQYGNKLSVLAGDYLLATACKSLASLRNCKVVDLISASISDLMQASFMGERQDKAGNILPSEGMLTLRDWEERAFLKSGSLLANSCQAVAELAGHDNLIQQQAFEFGKELANVWQVNQELRPFVETNHSSFDLTSLPVLLHLAESPEDLNYIQSSAENIDYHKLRHSILEGEATGKSRALLEVYTNKTLESLSKFPRSAATAALSNLIQTMRSI